MAEGCGCGGVTKLIFACSGCSDTGEIADRAARKLTKDGAGKMACLAGIGGKVSGMVASAKAADNVLAIDGCPIDCAKKNMEEAGIESFVHMRVTDMGMAKGKSPVTRERIEAISQKARTYLNGLKDENFHKRNHSAA